YVLLINASLYYKETLFLITLFTVFILYGGAEAEKNNAVLRKKARGLSVMSAISTDFVIVEPNASIEELYKVLKSSKKHVALTRLHGAYAYVNLFDKKKLETARRVADIAMPIPSIPGNTNAVDAVSSLENKEINIGAVTSQGRLAGIVTAQHLEAFITLHVTHRQANPENQNHGE
ncbi:MAG: CBS domain-containing protein, partial [Candidatus Micrarchaeaceae archaeon]